MTVSFGQVRGFRGSLFYKLTRVVLNSTFRDELTSSSEDLGVFNIMTTQRLKFASMASHVAADASTCLDGEQAGDRVNQQQLMRVYGALMWSLGRVLDTPEVCRVYVGSFHDEELRDPDTAPLLAAEMGDLLSDLRELPQQSATRRVNELVKRARL